MTKAETIMSGMLAEMNIPMNTADTFTRAVKVMFPDSEIARKFQCGRSKATALVKELSHTAREDLLTSMQMMPFTVSTDGSNDDGTGNKQFPIVVRTFDQHDVRSDVLAVPVCKGSATGENIFRLLDDEFERNGVSWLNCISLGCDNANVMTGARKGVFAFCKAKHPNIFLAGCTLHLVHIAAEKGANSLPVPVSEILVDVFYYFQKSSTRKHRLAQFQEMHDVEQQKMLKHVCTRWLSIGRCLERLLKNWDALKAFFKEEQKTATGRGSAATQERVNRVVLFLKSPTNRLYCIFLHYTNQVFNEVLVSLQSSEPKVHSLLRSLNKLLLDIFIRFVKPVAIQGKCSMSEVQYKVGYHAKANSDLIIGEESRAFIADKDQNALRDSRVEEFFDNVRKYFVTVCDYLVVKLPLQNEVLKHAEVADVRLQTTSKSADFLFFLNTFPVLIPAGSSKDSLLEEFCLYQCADVSDCMDARMDHTWNNIGRRVDAEGVVAFRDVADVMLGILTIPHSSAHCERVFSCVRKNKTDTRSSMGDDTLEALMVVKSSRVSCLDREYTSQTLRNLKGAYHRSLAE